MKNPCPVCLLVLGILLTRPVLAQPAEATGVTVPVLAYHRFGQVVADSMTANTPAFASHLEHLKANGYEVIPLRRLVAYIAGKASSPPARSVVITVDDGHKSVFADMFPLILRYRVPVTLFVYPSAISNASYAMTWQQLREMRDSGLVDIQSHTYWHPDFKREKRRLSQSAYEEFVRAQLTNSKKVLEQRLGGRVDMLAWPFGIYDDELLKRAQQFGYVAGFTLARRHAGRSDNLMALPRYLVTNQLSGAAFDRLLDLSSRQEKGETGAKTLPMPSDMKGKP